MTSGKHSFIRSAPAILLCFLLVAPHACRIEVAAELLFFSGSGSGSFAGSNMCEDFDGDSYTTCDGDCDDSSAAAHPGALEICDNGVDDNCNGIVDEGCTPLPIGAGILNSWCAEWRDRAEHLPEARQKKFMAKCMAQDCVQSLEKGPHAGCRWLDSNGFCYAYKSTQLHCAVSPNVPECNDGGEDWAAAPIGAAEGQGAASGWLPREAVPVFGGADSSSYSCSCLKDCSCSGNRCFCADGRGARAVGFNDDFDSIMTQGTQYSSKRGECACSCGGVLSV